MKDLLRNEGRKRDEEDCDDGWGDWGESGWIGGGEEGGLL